MRVTRRSFFSVLAGLVGAVTGVRSAQAASRPPETPAYLTDTNAWFMTEEDRDRWEAERKARDVGAALQGGPEWDEVLRDYQREQAVEYTLPPVRIARKDIEEDVFGFFDHLLDDRFKTIFDSRYSELADFEKPLYRPLKRQGWLRWLMGDRS